MSESPQKSAGDNHSLATDLTTESSNSASESIDTLSSLEIVRLMNAEDASIAMAIADVADHIAQAIDVIADRLQRGGRLLYIGAGTSGRLGVLDASECPPTFSTPPEMVVGIIAGGYSALHSAAEGIEDHPEVAVEDLQQNQLTDQDVLVGIAASGRTPYVIGGMKYAQKTGAYAIGFCCNTGSPLQSSADLMIVPVVGPEVVSGSTRLKAGTATKMVLNMLTTGAMVKLGRTFGNRMVDLRATNNKLTIRTRRLASELTGLTEEEVEPYLVACNGELKTAVISICQEVSADKARAILESCSGQLRVALLS